MKPYHSCIADMLMSFEEYRKASDRWSETTYGIYLHLFDKFLVEEYPKDETLTQEPIDRWCTRRDTEKPNSCRSRIYPLLCFLKFATNRNMLDIMIPEPPKRQVPSYIPHAFTEIELDRFFYFCDHLYKSEPKKIVGRIKKMTVPVFFRLLYSSGMRTTEVRLLHRKDIDLQSGIIKIKQTKGHMEHYVVLHDTMLELMKIYDKAIEKLQPNRTYFFECYKSKCYYKQDWVSHIFRAIWKNVSISKATPYDFRHHYAIVNINNYITDGFNFHSKFVYLSKSMGHKSLESTKYYYSLVPELANVMDKLTNETINLILPNINEEEK